MARNMTEFSRTNSLLLQERSVYDCTIRRRQTPDGREIAVAYIVADATFVCDEVHARLTSAETGELLPDVYVPLSALPYGDDGEIDDQALEQFAVYSDETLREWETTLRSSDGVANAAVLREPSPVPNSRLHLADLLPDVSMPGTPGANVTTTRVVQRQECRSNDFRAAISTGEPLRNPAAVPRTLQDALRRAAAAEGRGLRYINGDAGEKTQSYAELLEDAERILAGLRKLGLKPQDKVILQLDRNEDFVPAFWGCVLGGFVPAPISIAPTYTEANATVQKLQYSWELLDHAVVIAGDALAPEVRAAGAMLGLKGFRVADMGGLRNNLRDANWHASKPEDVCLILLTSGSTGQPKGVMQRHCSILTRSAGTAEMNGYDGSDVSLNWFPLDHVGGIVMFHLMDLYASNEQIHVPTSVILQNPLTWLDLIERHRATVTWAPNFAFGLINDREQELKSRRWDLSSMRFILNGGEAIVAKTVRRFMELLADHGLRADAMHPAWGMSETCSGVAFSDRCSRENISDDDPFVEVGGPIPGVSFRIVDGQDSTKSEGEIGRLQVKGPMVTIGYYENDELNRESFSSDGWFNTGDLAVLRDGRLSITGRAKDVIIVNGVNFYSHEIEAIVEEIPGVDVSFTAASATRVPGSDTDKVLIFFHPLSERWEDKVRIIGEIRSHLTQKMGINADFLVPVAREAVPKTAIGKIQRSQLRAQFERGEFDELLKEVDLREGNSRTVPNWFHRLSWVPRQSRETASVPPGTYLVFGTTDRSRALEQAFGHNCRCIAVEAGQAYSAAEHGFTIDPHESQHYRKLLNDCGEIRGIIHSWNLDSRASNSIPEVREAQFSSAYSLLWLVQALSGAKSPCSSLTVLTSRAHRVIPEDVLAPEQATMTGLLKTVAAENSKLTCRQIDVDDVESERLAALVTAEIATTNAPEVAYRGGRRLVPAFAAARLCAATNKPALEHGGLYLITGGLGGVGTRLAKMLLGQFHTKLLIVGRTPLPPRSNWAEMADTSDSAAARIRNMMAIESTGGEVLYEALDICDTNRLSAAVAKAERQFGREIDGVFHLAGEGNLHYHWQVAEQHYVRNETSETFEYMFAPKVYGTMSLLSMLRDRKSATFVAFSSVNSFSGAATFSAYSAANSFLDAVTLKASKERSAPTYVINWTMWNNLGMSRDCPDFASEASAQLGYSILDPEQALNSLVATLHQEPGQYVIGLDASKPAISRKMCEAARPITTPVAYVAADGAGEPAIPEFKDLLGLPVKIECVPLASIPMTPDGAVDREQLAEELRGEIRQLVPPRNELERQIAQIWCEVLHLPRISVTQRLFELGGDSLTAVRLLNRVCETFEINLPLRALFQMPSVAELAAGVAEMQKTQRHRKPAVSAIDQHAAAAMLNDLDELSDEDVTAALEQMAREQTAGQ